MEVKMEDGYTRIQNGLYESIMCTRFTVYERVLIDWIIRFTYGWGKTHTPFTWSKIARDIVRDRAGMMRAGMGLEETGVIKIKGGEIGLIKDSSQWAHWQKNRYGQSSTSDILGGVRRVSHVIPNTCSTSSKGVFHNTERGDEHHVSTDELKKGKKGKKGNLESSKPEQPKRRPLTVSEVAELGDHRRDPANHPDYLKQSFEKRDQLDSTYNRYVEINGLLKHHERDALEEKLRAKSLAFD